MGCGEDWTNLNYKTKEQVQHEIDQVFTGEGYRIIALISARHSTWIGYGKTLRVII